MKPVSPISVRVANQQETLPLDFEQLRKAVRAALAGSEIRKAKICIAVVDDATIARLNKQFLDHDGPTDVLSFPMEERPGWVEAEVVVSAETAQREAAGYGWGPHDELLLYVVHGVLHLAGYDDHSPGDEAAMRRRESEVLAELGIKPLAVSQKQASAAPQSPRPNPSSSRSRSRKPAR